mgnify:CR=1 FL=1
MATETKEIGITLGIGLGTYSNTEYVDGAIKLVKTLTTDLGDSIYVSEGYWESKAIDLVDKFQDFDRVVLSKVQTKSDTIGVFTRTSDDGVIFDEYISTTETGNIQSETRRHIQIKIVFYAGYELTNFTLSDFNSSSDATLFNNPYYIETSGGLLKLKRDYSYLMTRDSSWSSEGYLFRKKITRAEWIRLDKISIK